MTVFNRIGDRLARIVLPRAEASAIACGQCCFCSGGFKVEFSCLNHGCVKTGVRCPSGHC